MSGIIVVLAWVINFLVTEAFVSLFFFACSKFDVKIDLTFFQALVTFVGIPGTVASVVTLLPIITS